MKYNSWIIYLYFCYILKTKNRNLAISTIFFSFMAIQKLQNYFFLILNFFFRQNFTNKKGLLIRYTFTFHKLWTPDDRSNSHPPHVTNYVNKNRSCYLESRTKPKNSHMMMMVRRIKYQNKDSFEFLQGFNFIYNVIILSAIDQTSWRLLWPISSQIVDKWVFCTTP